MRYLFLTAYRNEVQIIETFLSEFSAMLREARIDGQAALYLVDDLSLDGTRDAILKFRSAIGSPPISIISTPTNLGNQGAMYYGLRRLPVAADDVVITFDCDGEDDVRAIPRVIELGCANPGRVILIERGRRSESLGFRVLFSGYKALFRFMTGKDVVPNNFLLLPGSLVGPVQRSPLVAVHFAYAILKLNAPYIAITRDRRTRYGGQTSQNIFMLVSHGLVGLMVFYEVVVAKLFVMLFGIAGMTGFLTIAGWVSALGYGAQMRLLWLALGVGGIGLVVFGLLLSAALAFAFKLGVYSLIDAACEAPKVATRQAEIGQYTQYDVQVETTKTGPG